MSVTTIYVGYIEEAWRGSASHGDAELKKRLEGIDTRINEHNAAVIESLSADDVFPAVCRGMFGFDGGKSPEISFRNRLVHFGACMRNADFVVRDWLDKFEGLLRKMYWESAYVRVKGGYIGTFEFHWRPGKEWVADLCRGELRPVTEWAFESSMDAERLAGLREKGDSFVVREQKGGWFKG